MAGAERYSRSEKLKYIWFFSHLIVLLQKQKIKTMSIDKLYDIFRNHPVVTTDSRDCPEGSVFFALKGDTFDGNAYALSALEKGCSYAVIDDARYNTHERTILVDDVLTTLQQLARHHRRTLALPIVGVTGTNGKTTTKELIAAVLSRRYRVHYTQGNFNNHIGVPKTLLQLTSQHEMAVVEMGANHPGEIRTLVNIAEPDSGIITNVGMAHLEGFGSFEGVKRTKGELYDFLRQREGSVVFLNHDNQHLVPMAEGLRTVCYGTKAHPSLTVEGQVIGCAPYLSFRWHAGEGEWHEVHTHLIGAYNIDNMLAAACIGRYYGVAESDISTALGDYVPTNNRSQLTHTATNHLVVDAYNANPTSMAAAIDNFRMMEVPHKMAIIGQMGELGEVSRKEHQRVVKMLEEANLEEVWLVGDLWQGIDHHFRHFSDVEQVKAEIQRQSPTDRYILIKGSNTNRLYQLSAFL